MKKYEIIKQYPIMVTFALGAVIYFTWRVMLSLFVAAMIIVPLYLAVQIFNDK